MEHEECDEPWQDKSLDDLHPKRFALLGRADGLGDADAAPARVVVTLAHSPEPPLQAVLAVRAVVVQLVVAAAVLALGIEDFLLAVPRQVSHGIELRRHTRIARFRCVHT